MYRLSLTVASVWGAFVIWAHQSSLGTFFGAMSVSAANAPRSRSGAPRFTALEPEALYGSASNPSSAAQRLLLSRGAQAPDSAPSSKFGSSPGFSSGSLRKPLRSVAGPGAGRREGFVAQGVNGPIPIPIETPKAQLTDTKNAVHSTSLPDTPSAARPPPPHVSSRHFAPLPSKPFASVETPEQPGSLSTGEKSAGARKSASPSMASVGHSGSQASAVGSQNQQALRKPDTAASHRNVSGASSRFGSQPTGLLSSAEFQPNAMKSRGTIPGALPTSGLHSAAPSAMGSQPRAPSAMGSQPGAPSAMASRSAAPLAMKSQQTVPLAMKSGSAPPHATQPLSPMSNSLLGPSQQHHALRNSQHHPSTALESQGFNALSKHAAGAPSAALPQDSRQGGSHEPVKPHLAEGMKVHLSVFKPYAPGAENCYNVWEELNSNPEIGGRVFLLYNIIKAVGPESRVTPADSATSDKEVRVALQELYSLGLDLLPYFDRISTCEVEPIAGHTLYQRFIVLGLIDSCRTQFTKEVLSQGSPTFKPHLQLDKDGNTLLHLAVLSGSLSMIDTVIEREHQRRSLQAGENPQSGHYWVVSALNQVNNNGKRPVDLGSILGIQSQLKHKFRCLTYFLRKNIESQNLSSATFRELTNALDTATAQMASADVLQVVNAQA